MKVKVVVGLLMTLFLFGQNPIFRTKLTGMGVQDATGWYFTAFQTRTAGDTVFLQAKPTGALAIDIVKTVLTGTAVQDFDFLGDTLVAFSTWGPDAGGWVYLTAELLNGGTMDILRTKLSGAGVESYTAPAGYWINGFNTWDDGEYVYLGAVATIIGIEEEKSQDQEIGIDRFVFALNNIFPNPVIHSAHVSYSIAKPCNVNLNIYDVTGRLVKTLVDQSQIPNVYRLIWHGDDNLGRKLGSGVYFIRMDAANFRATKKILLLK